MTDIPEEIWLGGSGFRVLEPETFGAYTTSYTRTDIHNDVIADLNTYMKINGDLINGELSGLFKVISQMREALELTLSSYKEHTIKTGNIISGLPIDMAREALAAADELPNTPTKDTD